MGSRYNNVNVSGSPEAGHWSELLEQARAASATRDYARAEHLYELAVDAAQSDLSRHAPEVFDALHELMHLQYCYMGDYGRSLPVARRAFALREEELGPEHPALWRELVSIGQACYLSGRRDEAESAFGKAAILTQRALGPQHPDTVAARGQLFQFLRNTRKYDELERLLIPIVETEDVVEQGVAPPIETLAWIFRDQHRWAEAEPLYRRLLAQAEHATGERVRPVARWKRELADAVRGLGRTDEAIALYEQALDLEEGETAQLLAGLEDLGTRRAVCSCDAVEPS
jgi:tetratricopeptide (TPR) repeat protein